MRDVNDAKRGGGEGMERLDHPRPRRMTPEERKQREQRAAEEREQMFIRGAQAAERIFATPEGKALMALLEWKFDGPVLGQTPEQSHAKAASREVVRYLQRLAAARG